MARLSPSRAAWGAGRTRSTRCRSRAARRSGRPPPRPTPSSPIGRRPAAGSRPPGTARSSRSPSRTARRRSSPPATTTTRLPPGGPYRRSRIAVGMATVVLLGTLDTKGAEYGYLRDRLREQGVEVLLVDTGVFEPQIEADVSQGDVAAAAGADLAALRDAGDRGAAVEAMCRGAAEVVRRLPGGGPADRLAA